MSTNIGDIRNTPMFRDAIAGDPEEQYSMGQFYQNDVENRNFFMAAEWYMKSANQGNVKAMMMLGLLYSEGDMYLPKNDQKSFEWYLKAANHGDPDAQYMTGMCFVLGQGVKENKVFGIMWLEKAAAQGDEDSRDMLLQIRNASIKK